MMAKFTPKPFAKPRVNNEPSPPINQPVNLKPVNKLSITLPIRQIGAETPGSMEFLILSDPGGDDWYVAPELKVYGRGIAEEARGASQRLGVGANLWIKGTGYNASNGIFLTRFKFVTSNNQVPGQMKIGNAE